MNSSHRFSSETAEIDRALVQRWLSGEIYWAKGRSREMQDRAMDGSRNYGVFEKDTGKQVAYARVVTDGATFAWLCDVFVAAEVRGQGVGSLLLVGIITEFEPLDLKRMMLATADAHSPYAMFACAPLDVPGQWMQRISAAAGRQPA